MIKIEDIKIVKTIGNESVKILNVRRFKAGYEIRTEEVSMKNNPTIIMKSAYTLDGNYIGSPKDAYRLYNKYGIKPELIDSFSRICSIGYSEKDNKWYGWSHRAICGFKIGDVVKEGDCVTSSGWTEEYIKEHPEEDLSLPIGFKAITIEDTKKMAIAFARSVS